VEEALRQALNDLAADDGLRDSYLWVRDYDDEHVYYETRNGVFRRTWSTSEDGKITLGADAEEVRARTEYVVVNQEDGDMADDPKKGAAAESQPSDDKPKAEAQERQDAQHQLTTDQRRIAELEAQVEHLKAAQAAKPKAATLDEYIEQAPAELRESLFQLHKAQERRRLELIDKIKAAPGNLYSDDDLKPMKVGDLEKLVSLAVRADYSVRPQEISRLKPADEERSYAPVPLSKWDQGPAGNA
jgi:hypothetical protein